VSREPSVVAAGAAWETFIVRHGRRGADSVSTDMLSADSESPPHPGTLTVASAPGEDVADVTARFGRALATAGLIAAADQGRLRHLAAALDVTVAGRTVSAADSRPGQQYVSELLAELTAGQDVLLVTGDGPAGPDDPDRSLIEAAVTAGIRVTVLPGPSAVTAALAVAGLPAERFAFEGAPPRRAELRERRFAELAAERRTLIFVESPDRLSRTLADLAGAFGADRPAVICRALAAAEQDVQRGTLRGLAGQLSGDSSGGATPRSPWRSGQGDVTVVVAGAPVPDAGAALPGGPEALAEAVAEVRAQVRDGATTRDAVAAVAARTGLRKRDLYNATGKSGPAAPARGPAGPPLG
jgi:16S rRNA (cytidine1402-2'-O)-methyltransferase